VLLSSRYFSVFVIVQIAKMCNESARDLENRELLVEISKNLVFKKVKVSNAFTDHVQSQILKFFFASP